MSREHYTDEPNVGSEGSRRGGSEGGAPAPWRDGEDILPLAKRMKQLEAENRRLKAIVVDQTLNMQVLNELLGKE